MGPKTSNSSLILPGIESYLSISRCAWGGGGGECPVPPHLLFCKIVYCKQVLSSSNVLHSSSLLLKVIWRCSTSLLHYMVSIIWFLNHHMVTQNMVSQSSYGSIIWFLNHHMVPLYGFSIIIWFHYMVSQSSYGFHYMVSQSSYGSIIWFLNHHMVSIIWFLNHPMVPLYGFSIIIWYPKIWFLNQNLVNYMFSKSDKCV